MAPAPNEIKREDASRRIDITCNVRGPRPGRGGARRSRPGCAALTFDSEYHPEFLGEYAARQESQQRLLPARAAVAASASSLLLYADFRVVRG